MERINLCEVNINETYVIVEVKQTNEIWHRLQEMNFRKGKEIKVVQNGSLIRCFVDGAQFGLDENVAKIILVEQKSEKKNVAL